MKILFSMLALILMFSMTLPAQTEPVATDKIYMLDGKILEGKVNLIKNDVVQFTDKETEIQYEINKTDIKVIVLASGKPIVFDEPVKVEETPPPVIVAPVAVQSDPTTRSGEPIEETTTETQVVEPTPEVQFALAGLLLGSLQSWNQLDTDESKMGFGFSGNLFAGVIWEDMYFGAGPHLGINFWTLSKSSGGYTASATTSVSDIGLDIGVAWEGFYTTLGFGSSNVSISATVSGPGINESTSVDIPESIGYTRVAIGWADGWAFGIAFVSYSDEDIPNNLGRVEFNFGWAF
jgi:hypothetical protein